MLAMGASLESTSSVARDGVLEQIGSCLYQSVMTRAGFFAVMLLGVVMASPKPSMAVEIMRLPNLFSSSS